VRSLPFTRIYIPRNPQPLTKCGLTIKCVFHFYIQHFQGTFLAAICRQLCPRWSRNARNSSCNNVRFCQLLTTIAVCLQLLVKFVIKFHQTPFCSSLIICGQTEVAKQTDAFLQRNNGKAIPVTGRGRP
jgi:hypothetical protein